MATRSAGKEVIFEPLGLFARASKDKTIKDLATEAGLNLRADCGGAAKCGKCRIKAVPAENLNSPTEAEIAMFSPQELAAGHRLACQAKALGPVTVTVDRLNLETGEALGKTGLKGEFPVKPTIERLLLPQLKVLENNRSGFADLSAWLIDRALKATGKEVDLSSSQARREMAVLTYGRNALTLVNHAEKGLTGVLAGERPRSLGLAVDIGTTTVAAYLCDLTTGRILISKGAANPQRRFGEDVISRIALANNEVDGLAQLVKAIQEALNSLIKDCLAEVGGENSDIDEVVLVGNTTMEQLAAGFHPNSLGASPYLAISREPGDFTAVELGLELNPGTNVHIFPVIHGYVGGDTVGAVLSAQPHLADEVCLIVDIGTNGELVLGNRENLWATSCATGPALEGAHISCGMRASAGAIHKVTNHPEHGGPVYEVLGGPDQAPAGVCGSGIIDLVASLGRAGIIEPSGRFNAAAPGVNVDDTGLGRSYTLAQPETSANGQGVLLELADTRQVQLAKAALAVGIQHLLKASGFEKVDRLVLTGAFGARFDWRSGVDIGLLPPQAVAGRVETVENGAGLGAIMALLDSNRRAEAKRLAREIRYIDLASQPTFTQDFTAALGFPFQTT